MSLDFKALKSMNEKDSSFAYSFRDGEGDLIIFTDSDNLYNNSFVEIIEDIDGSNVNFFIPYEDYRKVKNKVTSNRHMIADYEPELSMGLEEEEEEEEEIY